MSKGQFSNRCDACKYFEGLSYPQPWGPDAEPKCSFGGRGRRLINGCENFYPETLGCHYSTCSFYQERRVGPAGCYKGLSTINTSEPCFGYSKLDYGG